MKKLVVVINGSGGVGKDTLCQMASRHYETWNVSSITPIKELATACGWTGEKTDRARRFLSDLKQLTIRYNDFPTNWAFKQYQEFLKSPAEVMFVHIREGAEIEKFKRRTDMRAVTLLIRGGKRFANRRRFGYGNASDDHVENYHYDYIFMNDRPLAETEERFVAFLSEVHDARAFDAEEPSK